jgi:hypothetical protein
MDAKAAKSFQNKSSSGRKVPVTHGDMIERKAKYFY